MKQEKTTFYQKFYMWLIVLLPVLALYKIGPLDLDVVAMILFFVVSLYIKGVVRVTPIGKYIFFLICYIVVVAVANIACGTKYSPTSDIILRAGRYCLYLFIVFFFGNECVDYKQLMRCYRVVAYAATIYVIIQTLAFYGAGITLPNRIGGTASAAQVEVGRLRSFYSEPAVMSYSLVAFIACSLFGERFRDNGKSSSFDAVFVSAGIILSTSGQGILATGVIWGLWVLIRIKNRDFKVKDLLLIVGIAAVIAVLYRVGILEYALDRAGNTNEGGTVDARMSGYESLRLLSPMQRIFGSGFGNFVVENTFGLDVVYQFVNYSSLAEFLFTLGIVGTLLWVGFFWYVFRKGNTCTKVLTVAMIGLSMGGCSMSGLFFPLWLTLMCSSLPEGKFFPLFAKRGPKAL